MDKFVTERHFVWQFTANDQNWSVFLQITFIEVDHTNSQESKDPDQSFLPAWRYASAGLCNSNVSVRHASVLSKRHDFFTIW